MAGKVPHVNRWRTFADEIVRRGRCPNGLTISAPTSTGKSTELPAAILETHAGTVWLLTPTVFLRDSYRNPWVASDETAKLSAGVRKGCQRLIVCTYGHYLARRNANEGAGPDDIVIMDEFHERTPTMGLAYHRVRGVCACILASATPDNFYAPDSDFFQVPLAREYAEVTPVRLDLDPMGLFLEAKSAKVDCSRCLFIVSSIPEAAGIVEALNGMGEPATLVTAARRNVPATGHIVGTAVLEAGVNVIPPATCLISSGKGVQSDKGRVHTAWLSARRLTQQLGRVGRSKEGAAYVHSKAGSGVDPVPYPNGLDLVSAGEARSWLLDAVGVKDRCTPVLDLNMRPSPDSFMSLECSGSSDTRRALIAWWLLSLSHGDTAAANQSYDAIQLTGWPEHYVHVRNLSGAAWLPRRTAIAEAVAMRPYTIIYDGAPVKALTVVIRDGQMTWA
jgi:hypothetical protein